MLVLAALQVLRQKKELWLVVLRAKFAGRLSQDKQHRGPLPSPVAKSQSDNLTDKAAAASVSSEHSTQSDTQAVSKEGKRDLAADRQTPSQLPSQFPLCVSATWDGIVELCRHFYPLSVNDIICNLQAMRTHSVREYEELKGVHFLDIKNSPETFMSYERFVQLPAPRSAFQTRLFLYCELRLLELFTGDGETVVGDVEDVPEDMPTRFNEYVCENVSLHSQLVAGTGALVKLDVEIPGLA